jgi:hypothetical protein
MKTPEEIVLLLNSDFHEGFAGKTRDIIIQEQATDLLFLLLRDLIIDPKSNNYLNKFRKELSKIEFRAAYVLEYLYFYDNKLLNPYYDVFFTIFPQVTNGSTKRHFAKILSDILKNNRWRGTEVQKEKIAISCVEWAIDKKVRVAVKVWAIESLILLREDFPWLTEVLNEIFDVLSINPSAGIKVRLSRWRKIQLYF